MGLVEGVIAVGHLDDASNNRSFNENKKKKGEQ